MPSAGTFGGNAGGSAGSGGGQQSFWPTPSGAVAATSASSASTPKAQPPGSYSLDITTPEGLGASLNNDVTQTQGFLDGLGSTLFGHVNPQTGVQEGGLPVLSQGAGAVGAITQGVFGKDNGSLLGGTPIGDAARFVGGTFGGIGDTIKNAGDIAGGALEHISVDHAGADRAFAAIPDSPEKQAVQAQIAADPSLQGHLEYTFVKKYNDTQQASPTGPEHPTLFPELAAEPGSLADAVSWLVNAVSLTVRPVERFAAGVGKVGSGGLDRLQEIEAVHNGASYTGTLGMGQFAGQSGNTAIEDVAYQNWKSGTWTKDEALDFLSSSGAGFSHDKGLEILGSVALDPQVFGSLGAAGLNKLGITALRLVKAEDARAALEAAGEQVSSIPGLIRDVRRAEPGRLDLLGKAANDQRVSNIVRNLGYKVYDPLTDSTVGKAASIIRTIVDPLHAIGGNHVIGEATVDLHAENGARAFVESYGADAVGNLMRRLQDTPGGRALSDKVGVGIANYSANVVRTQTLAAQVAKDLATGLAHTIDGEDPNKLVDAVLSAAPKDWQDLVKTEMVRHRQLVFDESSVDNLANRLVALSDAGMTKDEWLSNLDVMSRDERSALHAVTYGWGQEKLLSVAGKASAEIGSANAKRLGLEKLILVNKLTLTDVGAQGILKDLTEAADDTARAELARNLQHLYPQLSLAVIDKANIQQSLTKFSNLVQRLLDEGVLPHQLVDSELEQLPDLLRNLQTQMYGTFTLAKRVEDDKLMGLLYDSEGALESGFAPWADHVANTTPAYRGSLAYEHNVAGMPIIGKPLAGTLDHMEAALRTAKARVNSATITEAARGRFRAVAVEKYGIPEKTANQMLQKVIDAAGIHKVTPRGLSGKDMWQAAIASVPPSVRYNAEHPFTERDLMHMVVDAYEGDLRFVGLTQKFTGRVKSMLAHATDSNFAGQVSENLYQQIKFRYNAIFQGQERLEPIILNAQRGVNFALGTRYDKVDREAARLWQKMEDTGLVRAGDVDQAEWSASAVVGSDAETSLGRLAPPSKWEQFKDVSAAKRLNMLRTFEHNLGQSLRAAYSKDGSTLWDDIVAEMSAKSGGLVSDDEAAIRYLSEGGFVGDVTVDPFIKPGATFNDFIRAVSQANYQLPSDIGELKGLGLDHLFEGIKMPRKDGGFVTSAKEARAALTDKAASGIDMEDIKRELGYLGAHPDYIRRVENYFAFNHDQWWNQVGEYFHLTNPEKADLQRFFYNAARTRGMNSVDYLSQVFNSTIERGAKKEGDIKSLEDAVSTLRAKTETGRVADKTTATFDDLMKQMVGIFHHHLDPSGKAAILDAFGGDIKDTQGWDDATTNQYLDSLRAFINGNFDKLTANELHPATYTFLHPDAPFEFHGQMVGVDGKEHPVNFDTDKSLGEQFVKLPKKIRDPAMKQLNWLRQNFPDVPLAHLNAVDLLRMGLPVDPSGGTRGISIKGSGIFLEDHYVNPQSPEDVKDLADWSAMKAKFGTHVGDTTEQTVTHEFFHNIDRHLRNNPAWEDFKVDLEWNTPKGLPSRYSYGTSRGDLENHVLNLPEAIAELGTFAMGDESAATVAARLNKGLEKRGVSWRVDPDELEQNAQAMKDVLTTIGTWDNRGYRAPSVAEVAADPNVAKTTPAASLVHPDVVRSNQQFVKFAQTAIRDGLLNGDAGKYADIFKMLDGLPTNQATPYNHMQQLLVNQVGDAMRQGSQDAFRLQYFAKDRSFLERSINHPFFGIYPSSYMWGKIAPELFRFMAKSPFGIRTGAAAYIAKDAAKAVAIQREFDPQFDSAVNTLGHSQVAWFLGYMLPAVPWDIGSAAPSWMRNLAQQGLDNQTRVDNGQEPKPVDLATPLSNVADYVSPLRQVKQLEKPLGELGNDLGPPFGTAKQNAEAASQTPDLSQPVSATGLNDILQQQQDELQSLFVR